MKRLVASSLALLVAACGAGSTAAKSSPHPGASASVSTSASAAVTARGTLFAILERKNPDPMRPYGSGDFGAFGAPDTVAIAGRDGYAVARASFAPRSIPDCGNAGSILQLPAQVANGAVFFADAKGVVRRLDPAGAVRVVATFPITSGQQQLAFAVRPDGQELMATVLTRPGFVKPSPATSDAPPWGVPQGIYQMDLERAPTGGATMTVKHWQGTTPTDPGFTIFSVAAWDASGPIAVYGNGGLCTQNAWLAGMRWFGGWLARVALDGSLGNRIGPDCLPFWRPVAGRFVCSVSDNSGTTTFQVVDLNGQVLFHHAALSASPPGAFYLSPDATKIAMAGGILTLGGQQTAQLPGSFVPQGWIDNVTVIGFVPGQSSASQDSVAVYHLDTKQLENWGFTGTMVGIVQAG